jgi:hypothetical protein
VNGLQSFLERDLGTFSKSINLSSIAKRKKINEKHFSKINKFFLHHQYKKLLICLFWETYCLIFVFHTLFS